jgi:hypothetical protein
MNVSRSRLTGIGPGADTYLTDLPTTKQATANEHSEATALTAVNEAIKASEISGFILKFLFFALKGPPGQKTETENEKRVAYCDNHSVSPTQTKVFSW